MKRSWYIVVLVWVLGWVGSAFGAGNVVIYPDPGDLSGFDNLRKSELYEVTINGTQTTVYASTNRSGNDTAEFGGKPIPKASFDSAHYCYFSFSDTNVTVQVRALQGPDFTFASIHPERFAIPHTVTNGTITFQMDQPRKLVLRTTMESDGFEMHPLIILADTPDTDIPTGTNVTYYGPGIHDMGFQRPVTNNETIYIAGGAIVKGSLYRDPADWRVSNFTLRGRGILYSGDEEFIARSGGWGRGILAFRGGIKDSLIEGPILLDSVHWNIGWYSENTLFDNIKIISFYGNTDGVHVGLNSTLRNSFIMCNDDAVLADKSGENAVIEDCVLYHGKWGNPFKLLNIVGKSPGWFGVHDMTYRNIDVVQSEATIFNSPHELSPEKFLENSPQGQEPTYNILFENIYVERGSNPLFHIRPPISSTITNITIRNLHTTVQGGSIAGWNSTNRVEDFTVEGFYLNGNEISTWAEASVSASTHVTRVEIKSDNVIDPPSVVTVWTGTAGNNDWNTAGNWDNGVPVNAADASATLALSGANVTMSAAGVSRLLTVSGTGTAPVLNITQDLTATDHVRVGSDVGNGTGYRGTINHTAGTLDITVTAGRDLNIATAITTGNASAGNTGTYNFGGLSTSAPILKTRDVTIGRRSGETGYVNLSGYGTLDLSGMLRIGNGGGAGEIEVKGGNLDINVASNFRFRPSANVYATLRAEIDETGFSTINVGGYMEFVEANNADRGVFELALGDNYVHTLDTVYTIIDAAQGFRWGTTTLGGVFGNVANDDILTVGGNEFRANYVTDGPGTQFTITAIGVPPPPDGFPVEGRVDSGKFILSWEDRGEASWTVWSSSNLLSGFVIEATGQRSPYTHLIGAEASRFFRFSIEE
jgi:hypothetical protein